MKHLFKSFFIIVVLVFSAQVSKAQLTFVNNSGCDVKLFGVFTYSNNPCQQGPYCTTQTILAPANTVTTLPGGPCLSPVPPVTASFIRIGVYTQNGQFLATGSCGAAPVNFIDCLGIPRTLQMFSPTFAAIF